MKKPVFAYIDAGATFLMAGAAVTITAAYLLSLRGHPEVLSPVTVPGEDWRGVVESGARVGPANAAAVIVEFVDFQCPFCREANVLLDSLLDEHPGNVALVMQHLPLSGHMHAIPAAVAAECAREQSRLWEMTSALLNGQANLGVKPWRDYATAAGIPDETAFVRCTERPSGSFKSIAGGSELAKKYGVVGTPTFLVNGRQYPVDQLRTAVERAVDRGQ